MTNYNSKPIAYWKQHSPIATGTYGQVTPRQLAAIRAVGNSQCIDFDRACIELFGCKPEDLRWDAALTLIDWLKAQPRQLHPSHTLNFCPTEGCHQLQAVTFEAASCSNGHFFTVIKSEEVA